MSGSQQLRSYCAGAFRNGWIQKKDVTFGKLPILVIDEETTLWEIGAIMRYLFKKTKTLPEDEILKAKVDTVFDNTKDFVYPIDATFGALVDEEFQECKKAQAPSQ